MTTGTNIKDRCRLCYTRLKDSSSLHHQIYCSEQNNRIYNIYKRRPFRYRDLIVRYLCINLPEHNANDQFSNVICGTCATALTELESAYRTVEDTQKRLRSKFRKTSQITRYQLQKVLKVAAATAPARAKLSIEPKRLSKRKGAPKHIDQTLNHQKKPTNPVQLLFKIHPSDRDNEEDDLPIESEHVPMKRTSTRRKQDILTDTTNPKKRFKRSTKDSQSSNITSDCINLLQSSTSTDTSTPDLPLLNLTTPGSLLLNSRVLNSVKGNHIERIAVSLLSDVRRSVDDHFGTETATDIATNGTSDHHTSDHNTSKTRSIRRKATSSVLAALEAATTNNILSSTVATILSPSLDDLDEDELSTAGELSNDSSNFSSTGQQQNDTNLSHVNKQLSSSISTTPTAEGLTITAINQTGQKQVFMAKQLGNLKKYQCGLCEKIVTNIQIHVRRHTNDKPYPCTYCEKRFTNSGDLQIHVRIHTGEKPYACPICLKSYRTIGNFNSHVKTHDPGTRPHRCEICQQTFPIPKDWYSHLRSSHRSRTANISPSLVSPTKTVTQPLFSNALVSQQQQEIFVSSKVKLEPINRSQLIIKSSNVDDQEPVNMSKKETSEEDDDDDEEEEEENHHHRSTLNLLANVSPSVHA